MVTRYGMVNMKLISLLFKSNLKKRKVFSITIFLLTIILIAVGTSTLSAIEGNGTIYEERYAKHKGPDQLLSFSNESYDKDLKGDLEKNKKIKSVEEVRGIQANVKDRDAKDVVAILRKNGDFIKHKVKGNELYVSKYFQNTGKYKIGDTVKLNLYNYQKSFKIKGFFEDTIFGSPIMRYNQFIIADKEFETISNLTNNTGNGKVFLLINWESSINATNVDEYTKNTLKSYPKVDLAEFSYNRFYIKKAYTMLPSIISIILLVATAFLVFTTLFVLRYTLKTAIRADYKEIGILRAIGMRYNTIRKSYCIFYGGIIVSGILIGNVLSSLATPILLNSFLKINGLSKISYIKYNIEDGMIISVAFLVICILVLLGMLYKVKRISPVNAITNQTQKNTISRGSILSPKFLPFFIRYALKQILSKFKQYVSLLIVVILFSSLLYSLLGLNYSFSKKDNVYGILGLPQNDLVLSSNKMSDIEEVERKIANDYDVSFSQTFSQTTLKIGNENVVTMVYGKIPSTIKVIKGNVPVNSDEIIIGNNLAKTLHKSVGDEVNIKTNNEKDKKYKIVGLYNSVNNLGKEAYILNSGYGKLGWPVKTNQKVIQFKKHEDVDKILDKNYNLDTSVIISNARSSTDNLIKVIQNALFFILLIVSVISLVLSALITFLLTMVNIKQEDSELKINRLLGFTVKSLRLQYVFRIEIITILGSILGFGIYYFFSESVLNMLTSLLGLSEIVVNLNFWSMVIVVVFFMVINLIITFISTYRLNKYRYIKK